MWQRTQDGKRLSKCFLIREYLNYSQSLHFKNLSCRVFLQVILVEMNRTVHIVLHSLNIKLEENVWKFASKVFILKILSCRVFLQIRLCEMN